MTAETPEPVALTGELEAVVLQALAKQVKARQDQVKAVVGVSYADGDKRSIRSPLGDKLGTIYRTDPDPEWRVVDREALHRYLREDPDNTEVVYDLLLPGGGDITLPAGSELADVVREHAPHLVIVRTVVSEAAVATALARAVNGKPIPGIARVKPPGVLNVRPDREAADAIQRMVQANLITWDGRTVLEAAS